MMGSSHSVYTVLCRQLTLTVTWMVCRPAEYFSGCHGDTYSGPPPTGVALGRGCSSTHTSTDVIKLGENASILN